MNRIHSLNLDAGRDSNEYDRVAAEMKRINQNRFVSHEDRQIAKLLKALLGAALAFVVLFIFIAAVVFFGFNLLLALPI